MSQWVIITRVRMNEFMYLENVEIVCSAHYHHQRGGQNPNQECVKLFVLHTTITIDEVVTPPPYWEFQAILSLLAIRSGYEECCKIDLDEYMTSHIQSDTSDLSRNWDVCLVFNSTHLIGMCKCATDSEPQHAWIEMWSLWGKACHHWAKSENTFWRWLPTKITW